MNQLPDEIQVSEVKQLLDDQADFLLLDCREQNEFDFVRIEGSTLLPMSEIQQRVAELAEHRDRRIVVHCHHGGRSQQVTAWLRQQGYQDTQNMVGGIDVWSQEIDGSLPRY